MRLPIVVWFSAIYGSYRVVLSLRGRGYDAGGATAPASPERGDGCAFAAPELPRLVAPYKLYYR
jgi:hypothetical protein